MYNNIYIVKNKDFIVMFMSGSWSQFKRFGISIERDTIRGTLCKTVKHCRF